MSVDGMNPSVLPTCGGSKQYAQSCISRSSCFQVLGWHTEASRSHATTTGITRWRPQGNTTHTGTDHLAKRVAHQTQQRIQWVVGGRTRQGKTQHKNRDSQRARRPNFRDGFLPHGTSGTRNKNRKRTMDVPHRNASSAGRERLDTSTGEPNTQHARHTRNATCRRKKRNNKPFCRAKQSEPPTHTRTTNNPQQLTRTTTAKTIQSARHSTSGGNGSHTHHKQLWCSRLVLRRHCTRRTQPKTSEQLKSWEPQLVRNLLQIKVGGPRGGRTRRRRVSRTNSLSHQTVLQTLALSVSEHGRTDGRGAWEQNTNETREERTKANEGRGFHTNRTCANAQT
jgi:hypothetical protein